MDRSNFCGYIHLIIVVPELVGYDMDIASSFEMKVIEDRYVHCGRGKVSF